MTNEINKILETINTHVEYEKKLTETLKIELPEYLKSLVKGFHAFRIGGYIPGFNDGDPCVFWLMDAQFELEEDKNEDSAEKWDEGGKFKDPYEYPAKEKKLFQDVQNHISKIPSDFFTRVYGDYFQLIVTESTVEVNEGYYPE